VSGDPATVGGNAEAPGAGGADTAGERVLVVPRSAIMPDGGWHGLRRAGLEAALTVVASTGSFEPRDEVERDPGRKQVIPYVVVRDGQRIFLMRRTRAGGDERLHDRYSIGVGGHLNPGDRDLAGGLHREWTEELATDFEPVFEPLGTLNDDTTEVGSVHLGFVFTVAVAGHAVAVRETDKLEGWFASPDEVRAVYDRLETWSQIVFDALHPATRKR
jgi:predicted NUDIX family phosphoesterase